MEENPEKKPPVEIGFKSGIWRSYLVMGVILLAVCVGIAFLMETVIEIILWVMVDIMCLFLLIEGLIILFTPETLILFEEDHFICYSRFYYQDLKVNEIVNVAQHRYPGQFWCRFLHGDAGAIYFFLTDGTRVAVRNLTMVSDTLKEIFRILLLNEENVLE